MEIDVTEIAHLQRGDIILLKFKVAVTPELVGRLNAAGEVLGVQFIALDNDVEVKIIRKD